MEARKNNGNRIQMLNQVAATTAHVVMGAAFEKHRGRTYAGDGVYVLFGNDGYSGDERPQAEAAAAVSRAADLGCAASDIQTDEREGYSWAVGVLCDETDADDIYMTMCEAWEQANEKREAKKETARK